MTYRPMVPVFLCFSAGILLNHVWKVPLIWPLAAAVSALMLMIFVFPRRWMVWLVIVLAGYMIADHDARRSSDDISLIKIRNRDMAVQGVVASDVEIRRVLKTEKTIFRFKVEKVLADGRWQDVSGTVMANSFIHKPVVFGQRLILEGRLHKPFDFGDQEKSSYADYLGRRHIQFMLTSGKDDAIRVVDERVFPRWRMMFRDWHRQWPKIMDQYLLPGEAGIMTAMMTGDRSGIPPHIKRLFVETGTVHILAISGLNMAIIAGIFLFLAGLLPVGFRLRMLVCLLMVIAYAVFTDGEASIVRSAVMAVIVLAGLIFEREQDGLNTLALSAFVILVIYPWQLFDLGFQLTFLCVWTMLVVHPMFKEVCSRLIRCVGAAPCGRPETGRHTRPVGGQVGLPLRFKTEKFFIENPIGRSIADSISISTTISIVVSGMIAYHFQIITPITVLANVIIVPLTTLLIIAGMVLGISGFWFPLLAPIAAVHVKIILNMMIAVIYLLRKLPWACLYIPGFSVIYLWCYFSLLIAIIVVTRLRLGSGTRFF